MVSPDELPPKAEIMVLVGLFRHDRDLGQILYSDSDQTVTFILKSGGREIIDNRGRITHFSSGNAETSP